MGGIHLLNFDLLIFTYCYLLFGLLVEKNEIRIKLTHGTAVVSKDVAPETVKSLNALVVAAYNQVKSKQP